MSFTTQILIPFSSSNEDLAKLKIREPELYEKVIGVSTELANNVILPIIRTEYQTINPLSIEYIQKFKGYCLRSTELVSSKIAVDQIGEINLKTLEMVKERLKKQQKLSRESVKNALRLIDVLSEYFQTTVLLIQKRKPLLEKALDDVDKEDLFLSLYGSLLAFVCFSVILGVKKMKDDERFSAIVDAGNEYANQLDGYTDTLDILTNPEELELLRKSESENV